MGTVMTYRGFDHSMSFDRGPHRSKLLCNVDIYYNPYIRFVQKKTCKQLTKVQCTYHELVELLARTTRSHDGMNTVSLNLVSQ